MKPFTKLHVQILLSKIELQKENIGTLSKLLVLSCCLFLFLVSFGEVVPTAVSLINTISSSHNSGLSPFEKLYGYVPGYSSFRVFCYTCFVIRSHVERSKLSS